MSNRHRTLSGKEVKEKTSVQSRWRGALELTAPMLGVSSVDSTYSSPSNWKVNSGLLRIVVVVSSVVVTERSSTSSSVFLVGKQGGSVLTFMLSTTTTTTPSPSVLVDGLTASRRKVTFRIVASSPRTWNGASNGSYPVLNACQEYKL